MDYMAIQFINITNGKQYFLNFDKNASLGCILKFASDYFHSDINKFLYCSQPLLTSNKYIKAGMIDKEIYFKK